MTCIRVVTYKDSSVPSDFDLVTDRSEAAWVHITTVGLLENSILKPSLTALSYKQESNSYPPAKEDLL